MTQEAPGAGLTPGWALDIKVARADGKPWDLGKPKNQKEAEMMVDKTAPRLLVGSPMCTMFSKMQNINYERMGKEVWDARMATAEEHMRFAIKMYEKQHRAGRYFLHEHPRDASSWAMPEMQKLMKRHGVTAVAADMCQFGMKLKDEIGEAPVKKPTTFLTNCPALAKRLSRRCMGCQRHIRIEGGGRSAKCAIYPPELCKAICQALAEQMAEDVLSQGDSDTRPEAWSVKARMGSLWAVRQHHGPRPRRYHPAGARGAPVSSTKLTGRRWTEGVRTDEHGEFNEVFNVEDNWRNEEDDHDDAPWIGSTWLEINSAKVTDEHWEQLLDRQFDPLDRLQHDHVALQHDHLALQHDHLAPQADGARKVLGQDIGVLHQGRYYDEISGEPLDGKKVRQARREEIEYYRKMEVLEKAPWSQAIERTGKPPIPIKWVDVKKSGGNHRSRLVAKEIKKYQDDDIFAATPPIESFKYLLAKLAGREHHRRQAENARAGREDDWVMLHIDVHRAYFYAKAKREVYVELPEEEQDPNGPRQCGKLLKAMYGTRDAAQAWQEEYEETLKEFKLNQGLASPCHFSRQQTGTNVLVHGDDFVVLARRGEASVVRKGMEKKYSVEVQMIGPRHDDPKEMKVLNRTVRWTREGISYEADEKHAEKLIKSCGVVEGATAVTPGVLDTHAKDEGEQASPAEATEYRADAARGNFLGIDRPDIQFAAKEISRSMSDPRHGDREKIVRLAKYLNSPMTKRRRQMFRWTEWDNEIKVYTDSDWAGCRATRKSTSGGALQVAGLTVKTWSVNQKNIALSSGEAELYAANRGAAEAIGLKSIGHDFLDTLYIVLHVDANAAIGIASRRGLGKIRHIETQELWLQEHVRSGNIILVKVPGSENPADLMTKHLATAVMEKHCEALGLQPVLA